MKFHFYSFAYQFDFLIFRIFHKFLLDHIFPVISLSVNSSELFLICQENVIYSFQ